MSEDGPPPERTRFLRRAIAAEEGLESARERIEELEATMAAFIRATADPMLLNVIQQCEALLNEALRPGVAESQAWRTRALAQLRAVRIMRRDDV